MQSFPVEHETPSSSPALAFGWWEPFLTPSHRRRSAPRPPLCRSSLRRRRRPRWGTRLLVAHRHHAQILRSTECRPNAPPGWSIPQGSQHPRQPCSRSLRRTKRRAASCSVSQQEEAQMQAPSHRGVAVQRVGTSRRLSCNSPRTYIPRKRCTTPTRADSTVRRRTLRPAHSDHPSAAALPQNSNDQPTRLVAAATSKQKLRKTSPRGRRAMPTLSISARFLAFGSSMAEAQCLWDAPPTCSKY